MKPITLRNLPPALAEVIEQKALTDGASLNKTVIKLLEAGAGLDKPAGPPYHDLDWFIGSWSKEEADEFDRYLAESRVIDPSDWEPLPQ
ncbi:MAG: hypothetical protein NTV70_18670 [Acidobacteria bacterium]|nr:hypothetical protein [Acidobacteriota bacterium]